MKGTNLGEFEELVLLAIAGLADQAYGVSVAQVIEEEAQRPVTLSTVHNVLYRLENKGYLSSKFGGATDERGGRRKRLFSLTPEGVQVMADTRALREKMWGLIADSSL